MTARAAAAANARKISAILNALIKAGEGEDSLETSQVSVSEVFKNNGRTPDGFRAENRVTVRLSKNQNVAKTLEALSSVAADNLRGPSFSLVDDSEIVKMARADAIKKAIDQSLFYAQAFGYRSAQLVSVSESAGYRSREPMSSSRIGGSLMPGSNDSSVKASEVERTVSISVKYRLVK